MRVNFIQTMHYGLMACYHGTYGTYGSYMVRWFIEFNPSLLDHEVNASALPFNLVTKSKLSLSRLD